jgi:hypothetical protein
VPALASVLRAIDLKQIPPYILQAYASFLENYHTYENHSDYDLQQLFKLS